MQEQHDGTSDPHIDIYAAGALCWRVVDKELQVLLIHRPRYDDWSFPKGKKDAGESIPETAVREVREEVSISVQLGLPLPSTDYLVKTKLKRVHYWAANASQLKPRPDGKEVDRIQWCTVKKARQVLSNSVDLLPLEALYSAHKDGYLKTTPLIILRHAKAKPRSSWTKAEGERTLAATGRRQAISASKLLRSWQPDRVVSSPWERCVQTVTPYVQQNKRAKLKLVEALTEASCQRKPGRVAAVIDALVSKAQPVVTCVHRPTLPVILAELSQFLTPALAAQLPAKDPYLAPGEILVIQMHHGRGVSVEQYKPFDD